MESFNHNGLLAISVMAKPGDAFVSYNLLQSIASTGLQFGDMNIFHFYKPGSSKKIPLFSLASATEPGVFDFDRIGDLSCSGLTLFMNVYHTGDPVAVFELMLKAAEQLVEDLDGELRPSPKQIWTEHTKAMYLEKIQRVKVFG